MPLAHHLQTRCTDSAAPSAWLLKSAELLIESFPWAELLLRTRHLPLPQAGKGDLGCRALYGAPRTQPLNDYRLIYFVKKCLDAYIVSDCLPGELDLPPLLLLPSPPPLLGK